MTQDQKLTLFTAAILLLGWVLMFSYAGAGISFALFFILWGNNLERESRLKVVKDLTEAIEKLKAAKE